MCEKKNVDNKKKKKSNQTIKKNFKLFYFRKLQYLLLFIGGLKLIKTIQTYLDKTLNKKEGGKYKIKE